MRAVQDHRASLRKYVLDRFSVSALGRTCTARLERGVTVAIRDQVPYANVAFDFTCPKPSETVCSRTWSGCFRFYASPPTSSSRLRGR